MRLDRYLKGAHEDARAFSKRTGIPLTTLQRALDGESWIAMRTAQKIVSATGGEVRLSDLLPRSAAA